MKIQKNISLSSHTSLKIGGPADFFCRVKTKKDLMDCLTVAKKESWPTFFLGGGSNIFFSDQGFRGLVVKIDNQSLTWQDNICFAGAGNTLLTLIAAAREQNLGGMEWAFGIPANLGGAVFNNAGAFGNTLSQQIKEIEFFDSQKNLFRKITPQKAFFGYRESLFQKNPHWIIWQTTLVWEKKPSKAIQQAINFYFKQRKDKQPLNYPSAGSFFRNPSIKNLPLNKKEKLIDTFAKDTFLKNQKTGKIKLTKEKIKEKIKREQKIPAGYLIEKIGLQGRKIGGIMVSQKHANFLVNFNQAKADDVLILSSLIKQKVRQRFNLQLFEEVQYIT